MPGGGKRVLAGGSPCTPARAAATGAGGGSSSTPSNHVRPKTPAGDSPYVRAKHAQLVEKDPNKAVALFWAAINSGDRIESALKDMALVMKQVDQAEEAIEAIKSFRSLCPSENEESLDNILLDLYKKCDRFEDQIELLLNKLKLIDEGLAFGGRTTKPAKSQGKKFHINLVQEKVRLLGNLAWAYMQCDNYKEAEHIYREALEIEPDYNKQCNLAICFMKTGRLSEAKALLQDVRESLTCCKTESFIRSFERASGMLMALDSQWSPNGKKGDNKMEGNNIFSSASGMHSIFPASATIGGMNFEDTNDENIDNSYLLNDSVSHISYVNWKRGFRSKGVTPPIPCTAGSATYITPPEMRKGVDGHGNNNRRWNPYQEVSHLPVSGCENKRLESRGPWTDPRSFIGRNQKYGTPTKNWAVRYQKPRTEQKMTECLAEDKNRTPPELSIQSQARASRRLNFERWNTEHTQISYNVPTSGVRSQKPLAEDSLVINGERWIRAGQMEKFAEKSDSDIQMPKLIIQSCAANENILLNTLDRENGCISEALVNSELHDRLRTSVEGSRRYNEEMISSNTSPPVNECMTPARDSSVLVSIRRPSKEHAVEKCGVETSTASLVRAPRDLTVNSTNVDTFREKVTFGSWKSIQYMNAGPSPTSNAEQPRPKGDSSVSKITGQTWADMVEEEEHEAIEKSIDGAKVMDTVASFKDSSEEHFSTPSTSKSWRTWADMVEEGEHDADKNTYNGMASIKTTRGFKNSPEEDHIQTQPAPKSRRRTWADMVEEVERLANENLESVDAPVEQQELLKSSIPNSRWQDCEAFQDENLDINIMQSTPLRHCVSKLEMVDLRESLMSGGKASRTSACQSLPFGQ